MQTVIVNGHTEERSKKIKNHWLIKNFNKRDFFGRELDAARRRLKRVQRQIGLLEAQNAALDSVTEIFDNVALVDMGRGNRHHYFAAADDVNRWADVYPNAQNNGLTFGVNINGWNTEGKPLSRHLWNGGKFLGSDWPSEIEACKAAKVWVTRGRIVEREEAEIL